MRARFLRGEVPQRIALNLPAVRADHVEEKFSRVVADKLVQRLHLVLLVVVVSHELVEHQVAVTGRAPHEPRRVLESGAEVIQDALCGRVQVAVDVHQSDGHARVFPRRVPRLLVGEEARDGGVEHAGHDIGALHLHRDAVLREAAFLPLGDPVLGKALEGVEARDPDVVLAEVLSEGLGDARQAASLADAELERAHLGVELDGLVLLVAEAHERPHQRRLVERALVQGLAHLLGEVVDIGNLILGVHQGVKTRGGKYLEARVDGAVRGIDHGPWHVAIRKRMWRGV